MFKKTETELILQLKKGSMKAFDEIYGLYARRLFAFCLKYTKSKENAEEIMKIPSYGSGTTEARWKRQTA